MDGQYRDGQRRTDAARTSGGLGTPPAELAARRAFALGRTEELIARSAAQARKAWWRYYVLQTLAVALAAITPCLIFVAKDNPGSEFLNWLQVFFPAVSAIAAGVSHLFSWRDDGSRYSVLVEALRGELWHFQTRTGACGPALTEEEAIDQLVTRVNALHLRAIAQRSTDRLIAEERQGPEAK